MKWNDVLEYFAFMPLRFLGFLFGMAKVNFVMGYKDYLNMAAKREYK